MGLTNFIDVTGSWIFVGFIVQPLKAMGLSLGNHLLMGQISVMSFRVQQQVTKPQKSYNTKFTAFYAWKQS